MNFPWLLLYYAKYQDPRIREMCLTLLRCSKIGDAWSTEFVRAHPDLGQIALARLLGTVPFVRGETLVGHGEFRRFMMRVGRQAHAADLIAGNSFWTTRQLQQQDRLWHYKVGAAAVERERKKEQLERAKARREAAAVDLQVQQRDSPSECQLVS